MATDFLDFFVDLEKSLHRKSIRRSREKLNDLLHEDFEEIGAMGKIYNKDQIIKELLTETPFSINASNFKLRMLADHLALLTYKTQNTARNHFARTTLRSSIWKNEGSTWKMIFHQGTIVQIKK